MVLGLDVVAIGAASEVFSHRILSVRQVHFALPSRLGPVVAQPLDEVLPLAAAFPFGEDSFDFELVGAGHRAGAADLAAFPWLMVLLD
jgi:hypothetical protein